MHRKNVLLLTDSHSVDERFRHVMESLDADMRRFPLAGLDDIGSLPSSSLVVVEADRATLAAMPAFEKHLSEDGPSALLLIVPSEALGQLRLSNRVPSDFILRDASDEECLARVHNLLWPGEEANSSDFVHIDGMTINLATYQVKVDGEPIDFTYLEYALLAFLVTHPGRTYSRDALLRRVWGFEYYGGSRTVDVHVRRVRAKLGTELAARLETVRGVGYLWNA